MNWNSAGQLVNATTINDTLSGKLGRAAGENVGSYAYNLGNLSTSAAGNYSTSLTAATYVITPAALNIIAGIGQGKVYGTDDTASGYTYSNNGLVNGVTTKYWNSAGQLVNAATTNDTLSGNLGRAAGENVGNYAYNLGNVSASAAANYTTSLTAGTYAITPAALNIIAGIGQGKVYGTDDSSSGFTYSNTGLINGVTTKYWNSAGRLVNAATINDTLSGNLGRAAGENVGSYAYNLGNLAVNAPNNYTMNFTSSTYAITPTTLSIIAGIGQGKVYGTDDTSSGYTYTNTGLVNGVTTKYWNSAGQLVNAAAINDTLSGHLGRAAGENVGSYAYNLGNVSVSSTSNYNTNLIAGNFAISPAALNVIVNSGQGKVYGTDDSASGFNYTSTGLINGVTTQYWNSAGQLVNGATINDTLSGHLGRAAGENVGTYAYNAGNVVSSATSNYNFSFSSDTFAITPAALNIIADMGQNKIYGTNDSANEFTYTSSGLLSGVTTKYWNSAGQLVDAPTINDTLSGHLGRAAGENVGNYTYTLGSLSASTPSNYATTFTNATYGITPATLTIIPTADQSKSVGQSDPTYTYSSTGLINNVSPSYWDSNGIYVVGATIKDTLSGNLARASGETQGNYAFNIGTLVVSTPSNYTAVFTPVDFLIKPAPAPAVTTPTDSQVSVVVSATSTTNVAASSGSDNSSGMSTIEIGLSNAIQGINSINQNLTSVFDQINSNDTTLINDQTVNSGGCS